MQYSGKNWVFSGMVQMGVGGGGGGGWTLLKQ